MKIEDLLNNLHDAYYNDSFENGVAWLNKIEHEDFVKKYPSLHKAITDLMKYRFERDE
jgi:hypothetical protein